MLQESFKKHWWLVAVVVAVLALGTAFVASRNKGGSREINEALVKLASAETVGVRSELTINLPERLRDQRRPLTKIYALVDGVTKKGSEGVLTLDGNLEVEARGPGNSLFTNGRVQILDEVVNFRLEEFPVLLNPSGSLSGRWTQVEADLLTVKDQQAVFEALSEAFESVGYVERQSVSGRQLDFYSGTLGEEAEAKLQEAMSAESSGGAVSDVVARLLEANNVRQLGLWIDAKTGQLAKVEVDFVRPLRSGEEFDFATLEMAFDENESGIEFEEVVSELTVKADVFGKLFGTGKIEAITVEQ